jgi:hypothetical protein
VVPATRPLISTVAPGGELVMVRSSAYVRGASTEQASSASDAQIHGLLDGRIGALRGN